MQYMQKSVFHRKVIIIPYIKKKEITNNYRNIMQSWRQTYILIRSCDTDLSKD